MGKIIFETDQEMDAFLSCLNNKGFMEDQV